MPELSHDARTLVAEAAAGRCPWPVVGDKLQDEGFEDAAVLAALRSDDLLTAPLTLHVFVENRPDYGEDLTALYVREAQRTSWALPPDVKVVEFVVECSDRPGPFLSGPAGECYAAFRALRAVVARVGHGFDDLGGDVLMESGADLEEEDEDDGDVFGAPNLTAAPVGVIDGLDRSARETLCRQASEVRGSWGEFVLATGARI
jgi:hypothetical protein